MLTTIPNPDSPRLMVDAREAGRLCALSAKHIRRMADAGAFPRPIKIGVSVRWRLRTGNPSTGILDWLEADCPRCDSTRGAK